MEGSSQIIKKLPKTPGVYIFKDKKNKILYIGKSVNIAKRVSSYFQIKDLGAKTSKMVSLISDISHIRVFSEFEALLLEARLIKKHLPFYNSIAKDDKSPLYIKITSGDIPLITTTRIQDAPKNVLLVGPYPSAKLAKDILRTVRRIFPYCQHKSARKPCLYVHLGLCPYPYGSAETKSAYKKTISKIKRLLQGKSNIVALQLTKEMRALSSAQNYEQANLVKNQLQRLEFLITSFRMPDEFLKSPTLVDDMQATRLNSLKNVLSLSRIPKRIECYDISNILGKYATGSMVVATNGQLDKSQYRRFKVKFDKKPNDYQMMQEVLKRRFKNDWTLPDLVVIDGGLGQLSSALKAISPFKLDLTVIALAKKREEIYMPGTNKPITLENDNPARLLLETVRDEAHRFAINYHRFLRSKSFIAS